MSVQGMKSSKIVTLLSGSKLQSKAQSEISENALKNAATQGGVKEKTLFEKFKGSKLVGKLGSIMGKMQFKTPVHLLDALITYAIGVVSGMQDMAQVRFCSFVGMLSQAQYSDINVYLLRKLENSCMRTDSPVESL